MSTLPNHLGGHENETHIDQGSIRYLIDSLEIKSVVDVGCGPGGMIQCCLNEGIEDVLGLDGDFTIERPDNIASRVIIHDFTTGPYQLDKIYDLAWTVEFVEHVDEKYMQNFIDVFKQCKYVLMTHALPGQPGHHHVNCQHADYWLNVMEKNGFISMPYTLQNLRAVSTMKERYIREQSLFFKNGRI